MAVFTRGAKESPSNLEPAAAVPYNQPRPLTAAAARVKVADKLETERLRKRQTLSNWQSEAWDVYDLIGEIKYAFMLTGAVMSRMRLFVAVIDKPSDPPAAAEDADNVPLELRDMSIAHLKRLESSLGGIPGLLRDVAINLSVTGEAFLVQQLPDPIKETPEQWMIRSTDEIAVDNQGKVSIRVSRALGALGLEPLREAAFIGRIWRPHPRYHDESDSSMRSLLGLAAELLLLNRAVQATAKSRLNAGAMFIPDGLAVAGAPDVITGEENGIEEVDEEAAAFEEELIAAMTTPIQDPDSASAVVPLLIRGPGELGALIKLFKFERSFDPALAERADRVLERLMQGIDVPKDVVTGLANVKYALTDDAQILTRYGWRYYTEVAPGDEVYTLNHDTGFAEWMPLLEVNVHDHDGPVLHLKGRHHSSTSTAEHRWPVVHNGERLWTTSGDGFSGDDHIIVGADPKMRPPAKDAGFVRWATARALGLHVGEKTPYEAMSRFTPDQERYDREVVDPDGRLRLDWVTSLTPKQAQEVLDTYCFVNRGWPEGDYMLFWDQDPRNLDAVEVAACVAGHAVHRRRAPVSLRNRGVDMRTINSTEAVLVSKTNRELRPAKMTQHWLHYTGKVWCPTTGNRTWLAKQNDTIFFTGNSNAVVINESMYRAHIEPLTLLLVDALTMMYMRPALLAAGFEKEDVEKVIVWYDPSDILTSADRAASASEGWDRNLLSGAAWRSAHGFAEADKPTGDELATRMVVARGDVSAELTEGVLLQIAPELMSAIRSGSVPEESLLETFDDEPVPEPEPEPEPIEEAPVEEEPAPEPEAPEGPKPPQRPEPPKPEPPKPPSKPEPPKPGRPQPGPQRGERFRGSKRAEVAPPEKQSSPPPADGDVPIPPELLEGLPTYAI